MGCVEACTVAENHGGEEDIRAALSCFFLHMYGDMGKLYVNVRVKDIVALHSNANAVLHLCVLTGMYLSETGG
jgi:hypothetical protein